MPKKEVENTMKNLPIEKETYNTGLNTKRDNFGKFVKLISNQFEHGGEKYALSFDKEITDWACELSPGETGADWILMTIAKYLGRFKNFQREKDILKIATYSYLLWIKMGFHLVERNDEDI